MNLILAVIAIPVSAFYELIIWEIHRSRRDLRISNSFG